MNISAKDVKSLREETGAGIMLCKKALTEAEGDVEKAKAIIKAAGIAKADKKADRETAEGYIGSYIHANNKVGVLIEVLCETDFVARNETFREMVKNVAMHIVVLNPENVEELLTQEYVKDPDITVEHYIKDVSGTIGEKFVVNRFTRYELGK